MTFTQYLFRQGSLVPYIAGFRVLYEDGPDVR